MQIDINIAYLNFELKEGYLILNRQSDIQYIKMDI